jgi:hypothetical protein
VLKKFAPLQGRKLARHQFRYRKRSQLAHRLPHFRCSILLS